MYEQIKCVCVSCRHVIMVDLTNVISWVGSFVVGRQRREEEVLFKDGVGCQ